ncbi:MAG: hypothetical protein IT306_06320 [Chloroflexi bacterium]|nr:hypothetical protein [Chloroflexota bacterium]
MAKRSRAVVPLTDQPGSMRRPAAVTLVGSIYVLQGLLSVASGMVALAVLRIPSPEGQYPPLTLALAQETSLEIVIGLGLLLAAYGLFRLRRWAWTAAMATQCMILTASLVDRLSGTAPYGVMVLGVLSVLILNQRDVRLIFEPAQGEGASLL